MRRLAGLATLVVLGSLLAPAGALSAAEPASAEAILAATGVKGGLVVHLGCARGAGPALTAALRANRRYLVHGLDTDPKAVADARATLRARGVYGPVSVEAFDGKRLPYTDNLVNLVVAEDLGNVPAGEVMRVLAPGGVAYVKADGAWTKTVKPRPDDIDDCLTRLPVQVLGAEADLAHAHPGAAQLPLVHSVCPQSRFDPGGIAFEL